MEKISKGLQAIQTFVSEVVLEARKSTWPERHELVESTFVVIVSVLMLALYVGLCDKVVAIVLKLLIRSG